MSARPGFARFMAIDGIQSISRLHSRFDFDIFPANTTRIPQSTNSGHDVGGSVSAGRSMTLMCVLEADQGIETMGTARSKPKDLQSG
jgi:hypothetical protein